jgi:hypothetical protein
MKRTALAVLAGLAALAAVASASSRAPSVAVPAGVKAPAKERGPLLAVVPGKRGPVLGYADKRAIWVARRGPKLRLHNDVRGWVYAPDGSSIVLATQPSATEGAARLQFIDPRLLRRQAMTRLPWGVVSALAWGEGRVNVVIQDVYSGQLQVVSVDAETHRVSPGATLPGLLLQSKRVGGSIVLLTAPRRGIGTATLAVVDPSGALRTVALPEIPAGRDLGDGTEPPDFAHAQQNIPALAVDPDSSRAFVIPASGRIAQVALSTLAVSYHSVAQPVSLFGRLHDWVEPKAEAKGANGPVRTARWLGSGVIAVTGGDETARLDASNQLHVTWTPAGLTLIDTSSWGTKVIDRGADSVELSGDTLLVTGSRWSDTDRSGMGFAAYGLDGTRKVSVLQGDAAYLALAFREKAYLDVGQRYRLKVVDLAGGRLLKDRHALLAQLLIGDGSN